MIVYIDSNLCSLLFLWLSRLFYDCFSVLWLLYEPCLYCVYRIYTVITVIDKLYRYILYRYGWGVIRWHDDEAQTIENNLIEYNQIESDRTQPEPEATARCWQSHDMIAKPCLPLVSALEATVIVKRLNWLAIAWGERQQDTHPPPSYRQEFGGVSPSYTRKYKKAIL